MSKCFIEGPSGGAGKLFAAISVTYPAGSILTCTDGTKTLKAKTTTGQWLFAIPYAATWIVTATDGTNTKSESVEITYEGQSVSVKLAYELVLYAAGDDETNWATYKSVSAGSVLFQATQIYLNSYFTNGGYSNSSIYFKQSFTGGEFKTLTFRTGTSCSYSGIGGGVGVVTASNLDTVHNKETDPTTVAKVDRPAANNDYSLDLSKLTEGETYYFAVWVRGRNLGSDEAGLPAIISIASMIAT